MRTEDEIEVYNAVVELYGQDRKILGYTPDRVREMLMTHTLLTYRPFLSDVESAFDMLRQVEVS